MFASVGLTLADDPMVVLSAEANPTGTECLFSNLFSYSKT